MAFKLLHPVASPEPQEQGSEPRPQSRQLALRLNGPRPVNLTAKPQNRSPQDIKLYIGHLSGQIEALRQQLREHSTDRIALLLREMIEERERELERWVQVESAWDRRVAAIEDAIIERDTHRQREVELMRERDEAHRVAAVAAVERDAAKRSAEAARREAECARRTADQARSEELRLRSERELDQRMWTAERRVLSRQLDHQHRGWLSRLVKR
jgi:hypothetical protein